jgi:hypothetical protein
VRCKYSDDEFVLTDTCGGIPRDLALKASALTKTYPVALGESYPRREQDWGGASIIIHAAGVCSYLLGCTSRLDIIRADRRVLLLEV